jgi:hypothetical protein
MEKAEARIVEEVESDLKIIEAIQPPTQLLHNL